MRHNVGVSTYNSWETGIARISIDEASLLCDAYGLTLDFIYRGKRDGLSGYALNALDVAPPDSRRRKPRS